MYSVEINHKEKIDDIWGNSKYQELSCVGRGYRCIRTIAHDSVLFIGINPSFKENDLTSESFYDLLPYEDERLPYFKKFHELTKGLGLPISHLDLLFHRKTNQKEIYNIMGQPNGIDFIWNQLNISQKILESAYPRLVVVSNALARMFLGFEKQNEENVWLGNNFEFDPKLGTHRITTANSMLKNVPIFFTSMLSGQRALDNGSFERLKWHLDFVNKQLPDKRSIQKT